MRGNIHELAFQPGEASWASWKCGGGPHASDAFDYVHPAAADFPAMARTLVRKMVTIIPYSGTESYKDALYTQHRPNQFMKHLPA